MSNIYYAYYDKQTKIICAITNQQSTLYDAGIEVEFDDVVNFLEGAWHFKDYVVDYPVGSNKLSILSNIDQSYNFKNNELDIIKAHSDYAECTVEWNLPNKCWNFKLDPAFVKTYNGVAEVKLIFFVTLESDFDFLIRTILINLDEMLSNEQVIVPFESNMETDISAISISSKMIFKNYKLTVYE